jgi:hypothetical protein
MVWSCNMLSWAIFVFVLSFGSTPSAVSAHAAAAAAGVRAAALLVAGLSGKRSCQAKAVEGLWQRMTKYKITLQPTLSHINITSTAVLATVIYSVVHHNM